MRTSLTLAVILGLMMPMAASAENITLVTDFKAMTKVKKECRGKVSVMEQGLLPAIWSCDGFKDPAPMPVTLASGDRIECDTFGDISGYVGHGIMQCALKRPVVLTIKGQETRCDQFIVVGSDGQPRRCWGKSRRLHN